jgi:hypothetical protein
MPSHGAPVYAKLSAITGDDNTWNSWTGSIKATYDFLYDKDEHLF